MLVSTVTGDISPPGLPNGAISHVQVIRSTDDPRKMPQGINKIEVENSFSPFLSRSRILATNAVRMQAEPLVEIFRGRFYL